MTVARPINYYGSKERMAPAIHSLIPDGPNTWVDVFCGSAIVTLSKQRHPREVINDLNADIINLFAVLRDDTTAGALYRLLELTPFAQGELQAVYHAPETSDPIERARRFLVASWFGRGGDNYKTGFRWSKSKTVAPELAWARLPARLSNVAERLRGVCIRQDDASKIIDDYDHPDCVLFVDPPYPGPVGRRYKVKMADEQHLQLADRLSTCRASVIMTMAPGTIYQQVLADWERHPVNVVTVGNSCKGEEILTNYRPDRGLFR